LIAVAPLLGAGGGVARTIDARVADVFGHARTGPLATVARVVVLIGSVWTVGGLRVLTVFVLLAYRRWQHLVGFLGSVLLVGAVVPAVSVSGAAGPALALPFVALAKGSA